MRFDVRQVLRGRLATGGVHAHVERRVGAEREAPTGLVQLVRGDAEVHQHADDRVGADEVGVTDQHVSQLAEGRVHDADATLELGESLRGGGSGIGVSVDAKNAK